jgi:CheY-like chemotaxis protein
MTIWMVVEDEPDLYDMLLAMYETIGVDGAAFTTGEEAVTWIEEVDRGDYRGEIPELALLDIRLPDTIDGITVGSRLRESPELNNIAIVLMTAYHMTPREEAAALAKAGANLLMYKPLPGFQEFQETLMSLVSSA